MSPELPRLPRVDRISDRSTFSRLRGPSAVRTKAGPLGFCYSPDTSADGLGVGFAIPRAVGNAVVRNRIRRRLRAIFAELGSAAGEPTLAPGALLVMVRPGAANVDFVGLRAAVYHALGSLAALPGEAAVPVDKRQSRDTGR